MEAWNIISSTVADEFMDLSDIEDITRVTVRLLSAAVLGGLLGLEREQQGKAAGLRTHILVCLGAALFVLAFDTSGLKSDGMSRVVQGIVAGVGFICAGTIIKNDNVHNVRGLTTAAGIWFTAAIGVAVGLGHEGLAILSAMLALAVLHLLPRLANGAPKPPEEES